MKCCINTSMLLSNIDIENIEQIGYNRYYFTRSKKGWLKLKNKDGKCVFHNGKICLVYQNRPEGCELYPLIFNKESNSAVVDEDCPYGDNFSFNKKSVNQLFKLVTQIISERRSRKKKSNKK